MTYLNPFRIIKHTNESIKFSLDEINYVTYDSSILCRMIGTIVSIFYGIRMEFLDIEMSKEEQLSFFADQDQRLVRIEGTLAQMAIGIDGYKTLLTSTPPKQQTNDEDEEWDEFFEEPRSMDEIANMVNEFCEKVWFDRHLSLRYKVENGLETVDPQIWAGALKSAERVIQQYGEENLGPYSDFEWGMLNGKLSALRWVMGEDWDELYT